MIIKFNKNLDYSVKFGTYWERSIQNYTTPFYHAKFMGTELSNLILIQ